MKNVIALSALALVLTGCGAKEEAAPVAEEAAPVVETPAAEVNGADVQPAAEAAAPTEAPAAQ